MQGHGSSEQDLYVRDVVLVVPWASASGRRPLEHRGPKDHINMRVSRSGSNAQYKGDNRNHVLWDPYVYAEHGVAVGSRLYPGSGPQSSGPLRRLASRAASSRTPSPISL